ncbi:serine hydrolase [Rhodanobacter lindaniclasticus]
MNRHVFAPAGMRDSGSLPEDVAVPRARAGLPATTAMPSGPMFRSRLYRGTAAGGGYSTAGDLLKFAQALRSGKLLPPASGGGSHTQANPGVRLRFQCRRRAGRAGAGWPWLRAPGDQRRVLLRIFPMLDEVVVALANVDPPVASRLVEYYQLRMPLSK